MTDNTDEYIIVKFPKSFKKLAEKVWGRPIRDVDMEKIIFLLAVKGALAMSGVSI